jgi:peptidoglycan/LPS O-acetylase OafA/YrhL
LQARGLTAGGTLGFALDVVLVAVVAGSLSALTYRLVEVSALRRKVSGPPVARREPEAALAQGQAEAAP